MFKALIIRMCFVSGEKKLPKIHLKKWAKGYGPTTWVYISPLCHMRHCIHNVSLPLCYIVSSHRWFGLYSGPIAVLYLLYCAALNWPVSSLCMLEKSALCRSGDKNFLVTHCLMTQDTSSSAHSFSEFTKTKVIWPWGVLHYSGFTPIWQKLKSLLPNWLKEKG